MISERVAVVGEFIRKEREFRREYRRFAQFFPVYLDPSGVLTKSGEEISPIIRGFITAPGSFKLMRKAVQQRNLLSEEERKSVREAAWMNSLSGNYEIVDGVAGEIAVKVTLDYGEAKDYLLGNVGNGTTAAFLNPHLRKSFPRHIEATGMGIEGSSVRFSFPSIDLGDRSPDLYIFTIPKDKEKINKNLSRMNLMLWIKNS